MATITDFNNTTFQYEAQLPALPVPSLTHTVQQLLGALKPISSPEEYQQLLLEASDFVNNDTVKLIQLHLETLYKKHPDKSYLNIVNNDMTPAIYGEIKSDILPRNPYLILEDDPYAKTIHPPNQAERSANLVNSTLKLIVTLRNFTFKPDVTPKNQVPLTMQCFYHLFGCTRIPDFEGGTSDISMKKYKHINDSRHIIILANNQYYSLEVLTEFDEELYKETKTKHQIVFHDHELADIFQDIIDETDKIPPQDSIKNCIGSITTQPLKNWKKGRLELNKSNPEQLKLIDDALFVVVLDSNSPETDQEKTSVISHGSSVLTESNIQSGTCTSRWYDKLQLIVTKNSVAGIVWESLTMDSTAILRFISDIYTDSVLKLAKNINGSEYTLFDEAVTFANSTIVKPQPQLIQFNLTERLQFLIHLSETSLADLINQHEYKTHTVKLESRLAQEYGLSVDSIMQICFQITNYSLYGRMVNTLEPIMTRKFRDARTELITVQNESVANLCKLYITSANSAEKFAAFKECCNMHRIQYHDAMMGKGFERHFMSIAQVIHKPEAAKRLNKMNPDLPPIPTFDVDEEEKRVQLPLMFNTCVDKLSNPELLISNCGNPALRLFGIPPAIDQGYGIGYIIHNDKVIITVCSKHRQTERFLGTFHKVIHDLKISLKKHASFVMHLSESENRKIEFQKLRIENELSHVSLTDPSLKHPISLTVGNNTESTPVSPMERQNSDETATSFTSDGGEDSDFELLGGYGYFDYGNLDLRSEDISRTQSNFTSGSQSAISSALSSRSHSQTNLTKYAMTHGYDIKHKQNLTDRIRDKLMSPSEESMHVPGKNNGEKAAMGAAASEGDVDTEEEEKKRRAPRKVSIGRALELNYH
ncbi:hypothetical protein KGF57_002683 [Candida theae]|uniref:Choline/carnitine acyltransferase domain-containing protein n=1 Tax=Candida theae TaxID=1198502 RepID=A0AAD5BEQ7_9ASCO|nr:uncharacterized protein KGF57_002683 [Candida theae]KAI5958327.1 hypothetical protein KGF57_002683 [Candida theae]